MDESLFIQERESTRMIVEAQLIQAGVAAILSKNARSQFSKLVKRLNVTVNPDPAVFDLPVLADDPGEQPEEGQEGQ